VKTIALQGQRRAKTGTEVAVRRDRGAPKRTQKFREEQHRSAYEVVNSKSQNSNDPWNRKEKRERGATLRTVKKTEKEEAAKRN